MRINRIRTEPERRDDGRPDLSLLDPVIARDRGK